MGLSDIRFIGPNTASVSSSVNSYMPAMIADSVVMNKVSHFGFHSYSADTGGAYQAINNSAASNKNFWMTEYANPSDAFSLLGQNAAALIVWEGFDSVYNHAILAGRGSQPGNDDVGYVPLSYNSTTKSYTPRKEFYKNAQLFKFVPPGSVRIGVTGSSGGITIHAFYHATSGRVTIVAQNTSTSTTVSGTLTNLPSLTSFSYYKTDSSNNMTHDADIAVNGGSFSFNIPTGSIVTLTAIGNSTSSLLPPSNLIIEP